MNRAIVTASRVSWQAGGKPNLLVSRTALAKAFVIKVSNPGAQPTAVTSVTRHAGMLLAPCILKT